MRAWIIVLLLIGIGIVGAWVGYWIGHALGWTTDAEFPLRIGAGPVAIGMSILVSFASVMLGVWWFVARPLRRTSRLLASGVPGHATIRRMYRTGLFTRQRDGVGRHQLAFELDVHASTGGDYTTSGFALLSETEEDSLAPGIEVDVRVDPTHPRFVAVVGPMAPSLG
jgi:hypothetical protein